MAKTTKTKKPVDAKVDVKIYDPSKSHKVLQVFVYKRKKEMQDYRKSLGVEKEWKEADIEYVPHELDFGTPRKRFETDQETGLRSRLVPIGDTTQDWRSNNSAPSLLIKIQTAFSVMIDQNPEAMLTALQKKYEGSTAIAYSLWKRNWSITDAKETLKLFVFDLLKYGWAVGRSYPRKISYKKDVLISVDSENPENNKYEEREVTWFNDVARQRLSPYKVWIDEQTKPYDTYTTNDCYYEMDFSYDAAKVEFGEYSAFKYVKPDSKIVDEDDANTTKSSKPNITERKDIVTIGFYENRIKDLYVIWIPKDKIILHTCPLPNDDGLLSIWHSLWILRSSDSPYGISIWTMIKQDKQLYDKMMNMTSDQLVLSIMKFGFHTGTSGVLGDGVINVVPGQSRQITNGKFEWMNIPGPGAEAWKGLEYQNSMIDNASGITRTLEGELTGKTLGEIQLAREAALKRLKTPLDNIAWAIEQDAYLTLSWMKQIYSTPEVKEFASIEEVIVYEKEMAVSHNELFNRTDPNAEERINPETGLPLPPESIGITATFLPELALHLEDRGGELFESEKSKFFQVGKDIKPEQLNWKGIFKVIPRSILGTSETIIKQTKTEMANMLIPLFAQPPELMKKAAIQLIKINEEDPQDWLPDSWLNPPPMDPAMGQPQGMPQEVQQGMPQGMQQGGQTIQNTVGMTPEKAPLVVPKGQVSSANSQRSGLGNIFVKR